MHVGAVGVYILFSVMMLLVLCCVVCWSWPCVDGGGGGDVFPCFVLCCLSCAGTLVAVMCSLLLCSWPCAVLGLSGVDGVM